MMMNRRSFLGTTAALAGTLAAPAVLGQARPRAVVIGGGAGGATAARYIANDSDGMIDVTLIEPSRHYYTCFFSNLYLGGFRTIESLGHSYGTLAADYAVNVVHDWATGIDRDARTVALAGGGSVPYDRLIVSPGIDFKDGAVPGWSTAAQNAMPHAYKAGSQTELLRAQLANMREGGTFAMVAPPNPYRCPPGPYERVSMVAHYLSQNNPTARILILDPKENFSKQALFEDGWARHYPGMIERIGPDFGGANVEVRPDSMEIVVDGAVESVDVCNVIPAMQAGNILQDAALTESDWATVMPATMQSVMDENIHILGDSSRQGAMPKSGFAANSQAKVAAMAVRHALTDSRLFPARFSNTCWSLISTDDGIKVGATYQAGEDRIEAVDTFISQVGESDEVRAETYRESLGWYDSITSDMLG